MQPEMRKELEFEKWVSSARYQIEHNINMDESIGQNALRSCINSIAQTIKIYNNDYRWWKNSIDPHEVHEAEKLNKRLVSLHTRLVSLYTRLKLLYNKKR